MTFHRLTLVLLYSATILMSLYLSWTGWEYYALDTQERPRNEMHDDWKPSGFVSHGAGIVGSTLMMILLLYSLRKRWAPMRSWGNIRYWLNYHIWMGITGPVLVIFHTTFKLGGIVAVSFWSMMAVALSGVLGRYIYMQIPRSLAGDELSAGELRELEDDLQEQIKEEVAGNDDVYELVENFFASEESPAAQSGLWSWIQHDMGESFRYADLKGKLRNEGIEHERIRALVKLAKSRSKLGRRIRFLNTARKLLHHWHVFHKPFAVIMILIMIVHVGVAFVLGYTWIF